VKEVLRTKAYIKWFDKLKDDTAKKYIRSRTVSLQQGYAGNSKFIVDSNGIYELRIHYAKGYRLYYKEIKGQIILLLLGGVKDSQAEDIKRAKKLANNYKEV